jgi:hypothetical protein
MIRYYQKLFGVQKFPGHSGDEGWLYRINPAVEGVIEKPENGPWSKAGYFHHLLGAPLE